VAAEGAKRARTTSLAFADEMNIIAEATINFELVEITTRPSNWRVVLWGLRWARQSKAPLAVNSWKLSEQKSKGI
jgi:hypothetical protein